MFKLLTVNDNIKAVDEFGVWSCAKIVSMNSQGLTLAFDRTITDPLEVREKKNHALLLKIPLKVAAIVD